MKKPSNTQLQTYIKKLDAMYIAARRLEIASREYNIGTQAVLFDDLAKALWAQKQAIQRKYNEINS